MTNKKCHGRQIFKQKCCCLGPQYGVIRINMKVDTIMENKNAEGFCEEVLRQQKRRAEQKRSRNYVSVRSDANVVSAPACYRVVPQ